MRLFIVLLLGLAASCGSSAPGPVDDPDLRILFIGNSLTLANDLPALVQHLGRRDPSRSVVVRAVAFGNYSLEDHWNRGDAQRAIERARWDFVVLQQGPSARLESRALLVEYATRFAGEIRRVGARPAIYMVWPPLEREPEWDEVTASHAAAAAAVGGLLLPGGEAIRAARTADPGIALFTSDGFHPALAGSYAVALVIYAQAAGVTPLGLTLRAGGIELLPAHIATLEAAASATISRYGGR
ncbi:MAG: hypothetical protein M3Q93_15520 [Gemmatimonadota bacterium]|nr:hypothetical protein [Gemmatimonadota bacterium]